MTPEDEKNLNILGGVLIVLSLDLVWCWYSKKRVNGMVGRYGDFSIRGMTNRPKLDTAKYLPGLNIENMRVKSMHDLDTDLTQTRRHLPVHEDHRLMDNIVDSKWLIDGHVNDPLNNPNQHLVKMPDEIMTPFKSQDELLQNRVESVGAAVMTLTDYGPQYGKRIYDNDQ